MVAAVFVVAYVVAVDDATELGVADDGGVVGVEVGADVGSWQQKPRPQRRPYN